MQIGCAVKEVFALHWNRFPATELYCIWPKFLCVLDMTSTHWEDADMKEFKLLPLQDGRRYKCPGFGGDFFF